MAESPVMAGEREDQDDQRTQPVPHGSPELQAEPPPGTPYGGAPQVVPGQQYGPPPQPQQYGPPQYLQPQRLEHLHVGLDGVGETVEPASGYATTSNLQGLPLVIGAVLLVVAGLWLGLRRGAAPSSARALGAAGEGILVAATLMIWLTINAAARNSTAYVRSRDSAPRSGGAIEIEQTVGPGAGAWLVLVAGILALVVAVVLVAGARSAERRPG
jgi:hypothetical protein